MDESWRLRIGSGIPRRKSADPFLGDSTRSSLSESEALDPADFNDVFGGPPRSVFFRQHSGDHSSTFYDEIFRSGTESDALARKGRNLPVFKIPAALARRNGGFYDDIFGVGDDRRSRSRSKSNSSSVLSSEDLSPLRPSGNDDSGFASFASKLRPIVIPCRQSSSSSSSSAISREQRKQGTAGAPCARTSFTDFQFAGNAAASDEPLSRSPLGYSQRMPSPETITVEPSSYRSVKILFEDVEAESPSSVISSVGPGPDADAKTQDQTMQDWEEDEEQEEAEFLSSYVIEILPDRREEAEEAVAVDEAIAWAKEKSGAGCTDGLKEFGGEKDNRRDPFVKRDEGIRHIPEIDVQPTREHENTRLLLAKASEELRRWELNLEKPKPEKDMAMEMLEEDIKQWSTGKEGNIRALLSTLQYILWPSSGWVAIPLTGMVETCHVKKAYQRARLCLHPDKLQQKGATTPQRVVAQKVFAILQEAWGEFNGPDLLTR